MSRYGWTTPPAAASTSTARQHAAAAKTIGVLMGLSGASYLAQGWVLGLHGFDNDNSIAIMISYLLMLSWTMWLTVFAWRGVRKNAAVAPTPATS